MSFNANQFIILLCFYLWILLSFVNAEETNAVDNSSYTSKVQQFQIKVFNPRDNGRFLSSLNNIVIQY